MRTTMSKVHLSPQEMQLVSDPEWLFSKQRIINKVYALFAGISEEYKKVLITSEPFPDHMAQRSPKISRGENYLGLPYVILDYPATFSRDGVLAIRTMFWWGNFFSITLHVSGSFQKDIQLPQNAITFLNANNFFIASGDEWDHHFEKENYAPINIEQAYPVSIKARTHFKIAKKISLSEWDNAEQFLVKSFVEIVDLLRISYQGGKKDL